MQRQIERWLYRELRYRAMCSTGINLFFLFWLFFFLFAFVVGRW